jgi:hypothetical protein
MSAFAARIAEDLAAASATGQKGRRPPPTARPTRLAAEHPGRELKHANPGP